MDAARLSELSVNVGTDVGTADVGTEGGHRWSEDVCHFI